MKLIDTLLLSFALATCLIGFHRLFVNDNIFDDYWVFMLTIISLAWYQMRKRKQAEEESTEQARKTKKNKKSKKK